MDSGAQRLRQGQSREIVLYAMAACPAGVYPYDINPQTSRVYTQCNEWRNGVFARP